MEQNNYGSNRDLSENENAASYLVNSATENQLQQFSNCQAIYDDAFQQASANLYSELVNKQPTPR